MANKELSADGYLNKAERYCAYAERCASQVRMKLQQWDCPEKEWVGIISQLYKSGFLNDERFACAYCHDKLLYQGWGRKKIEVMLSGLQLPVEAINAAIAEINEDDYRRILKKVAGQKRGATREQLVRFLLQRGFLYGEIKSVLAL